MSSALVNKSGECTDKEYNVNFYFHGIKREPSSVIVAKDNLKTTEFNFNKIPVNKPFSFFESF